MPRFDFLPTALAGLIVVQRKSEKDNRGFFSRFFCAEEFREAGLVQHISQINHTMTRRMGAVRGMHYQYPPYAETKLVSCVRGEIYDAAVDIRRDSPTFLTWHSEFLTAANQRSLLIPEGFAHGFQAMSEDCELIYLHTAAFQPSAQGALNPADPRLGIAWPLEITEMSDRDRRHPMLSATFCGVDL